MVYAMALKIAIHVILTVGSATQNLAVEMARAMGQKTVHLVRKIVALPIIAEMATVCPIWARIP